MPQIYAVPGVGLYVDPIDGKAPPCPAEVIAAQTAIAGMGWSAINPFLGASLMMTAQWLQNTGAVMKHAQMGR